ncbi:MAG: HD domain-containing protein, partial [Spirochaetales bacterium]|nr:HD domain-containing protein [Spirochaetales bacterium]
SDYFKYPYSHKARIISTLQNTMRDIIYDKEISDLYRIGTELSTESNLDILIEKILEASLKQTNADEGSFYLVTDDKDPQTGERLMQFEHSVGRTLPKRYKKVKLPINDQSIVGYAIKHGACIKIADVYKLPPNAAYHFNDSIDRKYNYRSKSMLVIPMINHKNQIIGAIQLLNKRKVNNIQLTSPEIVEKYVIPFDIKSERMIQSIGGQASIAVENDLLYQEIQNLFESFVNASVIAVESRDPSTGGHSRRVSKLTTAIANLINITKDGPLANIHFTEEELKTISYAGLLHDFGKIGIPEKILIKAKKLFTDEMYLIQRRINIHEYSQYVQSGNYTQTSSEDIIAETEKLRKAIYNANEPGLMTDDVKSMLKTANETDIVYLNGDREKVLTDEEYTRLMYSRGSLSSEEYDIMKSHVEHSYDFLSRIVWPVGLTNIPTIARAHHEKLDGSGYPLGLKGDEIPIEAQIMCIADIFDALTANDRPYKNRMPTERALMILKMEAQQGKINKDILDLMINSMIYQIILDDDQKQDK